MFMLVQSLDTVDWRQECITHSTVISISCFIKLAFFAVISIEQLDTLTGRPQVVDSLATVMPVLVDRVLKKDTAGCLRMLYRIRLLWPELRLILGSNFLLMTLNHAGRQFKDVAPKLSTIRSAMRRGKEEHAVNTAGKQPRVGYCFARIRIFLIANPPLL